MSVPEDLRNHAVWIGSIGGRLDMANLKGFDKIVAKLVSKAVKENQTLYENLDINALDELAAYFQ
jgi:hypothetical protein